jgi:putative membrane protein
MMSPDAHESEQSSPEPSPSATRDLLANERTLLAWARTGVAIMGLGFVVARFGLAIRQLTVGGGALAPRGVSTAFGVALVLSGALLLVLAMIRYRRVAQDILHNRVRWDPRLGILLTGLLVLTGLLLAVYLLLTS